MSDAEGQADVANSLERLLSDHIGRQRLLMLFVRLDDVLLQALSNDEESVSRGA